MSHSSVDLFCPPIVAGSRPRLLCLSHLRWDFVTLRPHHLMRRAARRFDVLFWEEPRAVADAPSGGRLERAWDGEVQILTPLLPPRLIGTDAAEPVLRALLDGCLDGGTGPLVLWHSAPMMVGISRHLRPAVTVYDCVEAVSALPAALESELVGRADLIFTGGHSLQEAWQRLHPAVHCFPSAVERGHFARARLPQPDPEAQAHIPHPRVGFCGVIDQRLDLALVVRTARDSSHIHFVMVGPVTGIDPAHLPKAHNLHWLGRQDYKDLPHFMANWQVGWMPYLVNEDTRYLSPVQTPEFLAAGLPLISTAIHDVIRIWGAAGLVRIADRDTMTLILQTELKHRPLARSPRIDATLARSSWDDTWAEMEALISEVMTEGGLPVGQQARGFMQA
ncbi:MAG: hypothetical protein ORN49_13700 [Rhodobacteraceae bacterium]|nr:hypothetical protein [Paracoccaceae bacterium]